MHSTVLRSSETGGYNDMQCTLFGHDGGVLRRLPSRFGIGDGCCHCERLTKQMICLTIKGILLPISGKTKVDLIPM